MSCFVKFVFGNAVREMAYLQHVPKGIILYLFLTSMKVREQNQDQTDVLKIGPHLHKFVSGDL